MACLFTPESVASIRPYQPFLVRRSDQLLGGRNRSTPTRVLTRCISRGRLTAWIESLVQGLISAALLIAILLFSFVWPNLLILGALAVCAIGFWLWTRRTDRRRATSVE